MFTKILIANRGEIACRVAATARKMGIRTVAVYSDADAHAKHVAVCDEAYRLGPAPARESYLKGDLILQIAKRSGAQAIHPGYGFLSENDDFADACEKAGVVFIGPPSSAIRAMGLKAASKQLMEAAKVPLVPGYHGADQTPALLQAQADRIGYPVLIKASAGGGGKGMRIVEASADFSAALASCQREAVNAFGDDAVLIEKYLQRPRHIEIQVFADTLGNCVYLFERDCSVQRRHQKVLEEAPAPGMTAERRAAMGEAAVAAAKAVKYVGAGTVEFIANQDGSFYFMEMNTRLQVEHPVTEMVTGHDLVEWQLRVAAGERLPALQHELQLKGHAIEARLYAENPDTGFLPSSGTLTRFAMPQAASFTGDTHVRIDSGVRAGDEISPHYDPMIAKLIVWGEDRAAALRRLDAALSETQIVGLSSNVEFLRRVLACDAFASGAVDTGLIERNRAELFPAPRTVSTAMLAAVCLEQLAEEARQSGVSKGNARRSPFDAVLDANGNPGGWWPNLPATRSLHFMRGEERLAVRIVFFANACTIESEGVPRAIVVGQSHEGRVDALVGEQHVAAQVVRAAEGRRVVFINGWRDEFTYVDLLDVKVDAVGHGGGLVSPMPGKILSLIATPGAMVKRGAPLLVMEAMKMEHTINAPSAGKVVSFCYAVGDQVAEGAELVEFEDDPAK